MPKPVYNSSTPIKLNFDPVSKNSNSTANTKMSYEKIYPGIYLTSMSDLCSADNLKIYGFTHIIYIDKHIIQTSNTNDYVNFKLIHTQNNNCEISCSDLSKNNDDGNVIKNINETSITASITIRHTTNQINSNASICCDGSNNNNTITMDTSRTSNKTDCSTYNNQEMPIDDEPSTTLTSARELSVNARNEILFGHSDFETLDLNFGESSYLTTVLPNCYKAVKFIENALKNNGAVLIIDCMGENQKCITIVIGFLMYKYNKNFL